jgi:hypothetical protein
MDQLSIPFAISNDPNNEFYVRSKYYRALVSQLITDLLPSELEDTQPIRTIHPLYQPTLQQLHKQTNNRLFSKAPFLGAFCYTHPYGI